jgi:hypothetical protein
MATPTEPKRWDERVRLRAYYLWEAEGRPLGRNDEFWDRAHREIIAETAAEAKTASSNREPPKT